MICSENMEDPAFDEILGFSREHTERFHAGTNPKKKKKKTSVYYKNTIMPLRKQPYSANKTK